MALENFSDENLTKISKADYWEPPVLGGEADDIGEMINTLLEKAVTEAYQDGIKHALEAIRDGRSYIDLHGYNLRCILMEPAFDGTDLTITEPLEELLTNEAAMHEEPWPEMAALLRRCADLFEKKP